MTIPNCILTKCTRAPFSPPTHQHILSFWKNCFSNRYRMIFNQSFDFNFSVSDTGHSYDCWPFVWLLLRNVCWVLKNCRLTEILEQIVWKPSLGTFYTQKPCARWKSWGKGECRRMMQCQGDGKKCESIGVILLGTMDLLTIFWIKLLFIWFLLSQTLKI